jgi:hypothetical protein
MADEELARRVEELRQDFAVERGTQFEHFFCPILNRDEAVTLCRGHIISQKLGGRTWVPQREDVDNFYGHAVEGDFVTIAKHREADLLDIWLDPKKRRQLRPRLQYDGKEIDHYFAESTAPTPGTQSVGPLITEDGQKVCKVTLKVSSEELGEMDGKTIHLVVDHDYRSAVVAWGL